MDNFLGKYGLPKWNLAGKKHLNQLISPEELEKVIKELTQGSHNHPPHTPVCGLLGTRPQSRKWASM